jgi:hypothetical protein
VLLHRGHLPAVSSGTAFVKCFTYSHALHFHRIERSSWDVHRLVRRVHKSRDGTTGDVYDVLTRILGLNPPFVSISLEDVKARMKGICCEGQDPNIRAALNQIESVFKDGGEPVQWDDDKRLLAVIDPHFYFYLRCQLPNEVPAEHS